MKQNPSFFLMYVLFNLTLILSIRLGIAVADDIPCELDPEQTLFGLSDSSDAMWGQSVAVSADYVAIGSQTNAVRIYHKQTGHWELVQDIHSPLPSIGF